MTHADESQWHERAAALTFETNPFIDGDFRPSESQESFATADPFRVKELARFSDCGAADIDRAVAAARRAFRETWRSITPEARKAKLLAFADAIRAHGDELALRDSVEMGKPISQARGEARGAADFLQYYAELADKITGDIAAGDNPSVIGLTIREPRGVIGIITPWNFPLYTAIGAIGPALAAGNCVVVKPSEISPSSALLLAKIASEAGIPDGVLNVVPGTGARAGAALALHHDVDKLHFTGSTVTGLKLMEAAGQSNGKPVMLETGGKSPQIVFQDALDTEGLGAALASAVFANSGQICVARTRLIVHRSIKDAVVERVIEGAKQAFTAGHPLDQKVNFGPICNHRQYERVTGYRQIGDDEGGAPFEVELPGHVATEGYYVPPIIMTNASPSMKVSTEEVFGPILSVLTFDSDDEAVALANGTDYGLASTAWTNDLKRARRLIRDIDAGRVDIRTSGAPGLSLAHITAEPFGHSGHGPLGGIDGLMPYLRLKGAQIITG